MERNYTIKWYDLLDSTNNEAIKNIDSYDNLSVIAAVEQTAGKGQRGNRWFSRPGENLTFSIVCRFEELPPHKQFLVSEAVALGLREYMRAKGLKASVKWPNDIYVGDKKICGVLIENCVRGNRLYASVAGIGINLNQTGWGESAPNPTSLAIETGRTDYDPKAELTLVIASMDRYLAMITEDPASLDSEYGDSLYRLGEWHDFRDTASGMVFKGSIQGVTEKGTLLVKDEEGAVKEYAFKEIAYIL